MILVLTFRIQLLVVMSKHNTKEKKTLTHPILITSHQTLIIYIFI